MRHVALLLGIIFPGVIVADQLTINVPSAVANTIREYRACSLRHFSVGRDQHLCAGWHLIGAVVRDRAAVRFDKHAGATS